MRARPIALPLSLLLLVAIGLGTGQAAVVERWPVAGAVGSPVAAVSALDATTPVVASRLDAAVDQMAGRGLRDPAAVGRLAAVLAAALVATWWASVTARSAARRPVVVRAAAPARAPPVRR